MSRIHLKAFFFTIYFFNSRAMMMRNDALISKMVSNFQKDNTLAIESNPKRSRTDQPKSILTLMQNVLCRNFPTIPCDMIVEDDKLRALIERSIQQLKYKKLSLDKTTPVPGYHLTLFPTVNSEDLSNFLQVSETGYYPKDKEKSKNRKNRKRLSKTNGERKEYKKKATKKRDSQKGAIYGSPKKIRKFYPHKVKYKDKSTKASRGSEFRDYSEEKLSMSVELPEPIANRKRINTNYNMDPADPPVWRIDYMKHGEPVINMFNYEPDRLQEKLVKTGPNVIVGQENFMDEVKRKDVLHPDVYIKKNFIRKNAVDMNSGGLD